MTKITQKIDIGSVPVIVLHGTISPFVIQICNTNLAKKAKFAMEKR